MSGQLTAKASRARESHLLRGGLRAHQRYWALAAMPATPRPWPSPSTCSFLIANGGAAGTEPQRVELHAEPSPDIDQIDELVGILAEAGEPFDEKASAAAEGCRELGGF